MCSFSTSGEELILSRGLLYGGRASVQVALLCEGATHVATAMAKHLLCVPGEVAGGVPY